MALSTRPTAADELLRCVSELLIRMPRTMASDHVAALFEDALRTRVDQVDRMLHTERVDDDTRRRLRRARAGLERAMLLIERTRQNRESGVRRSVR